MRVGENGALVVVDAQRDFIDGALAVPGAREAMEKVDALVLKFYDARLPVVYTACSHPADHCSFVAQGGRWPPHCVQGTIGEHVVARTQDSAPHIFRKGTEPHEDSYSGFGGRLPDGTRLHQWLRDRGVERLVICGLATDYCVKATAIEAARREYDAVVVLDAIAAVTGDGMREAMEEMKAESVRFRVEHWVRT